MADSFDITCGRCGYVLRGLPEGARCPECALPADWSRGIFAIRDYQRRDEKWTGRLSVGLRLLLLAQCILVLTLGCSIVNDFIHFTRFPFFLWTLPLVAILGAGGAWMITSPALFADFHRWWAWVRRSVRIAAIATALAGIAVWLTAWHGQVYWLWPVLLLMLVWQSAIVLTFAYLSAAADELGCERLAANARYVMWSLPLAIVSPIVAGVSIWLLRIPLTTSPAIMLSAIVLGMWFIANYSTAVATIFRLRWFLRDLMLLPAVRVES